MAHPGTVEGEFGADHAALRLILIEVVEALRAEDRVGAARRYQAFEGGLRSHLLAEEQTLFADFEQHTGLREAGPTVMLRLSHRHVEQRLAKIAQAFAEDCGVEMLTVQIEQLRALLADQSVREEAILYPSCDRLLSAPEVKRAVSALRDKRGKP